MGVTYGPTVRDFRVGVGLAVEDVAFGVFNGSPVEPSLWKHAYGQIEDGSYVPDFLRHTQLCAALGVDLASPPGVQLSKKRVEERGAAEKNPSKRRLIDQYEPPSAAPNHAYVVESIHRPIFTLGREEFEAMVSPSKVA